MDKEKFSVILPIIVSDLTAFIVDKENLSEKEAIRMVYSSQIYKYLENEDTKFWHYSTGKLYLMLKEEQKNGNITLPDI